MLGGIRAFFAPKRRRDAAQHDEEQGKGDANGGARRAARAADLTTAHAESGAFDGADAECAEKRMPSMRVARGDQGTSGVEPTGDVDENSAAAATMATTATTKDKKKCVLCKRATVRHTVSNFFVGTLLNDILGTVFNRYSRAKRKRIGTIDPAQKFCQGDGLCQTCASVCEDCVRDRDEARFDSTVNNARKLQILSAHVRDHLDGKVPRQNDVATLARWDHEDAGERDGVQVGRWWNDLTHSKNKERLQRLRNFDDASKNALAYLATCEFREDGRACKNTAHDARKLQILSAHVRDHLDGKVPRQNDVATLARWDREDAGERDGVQVGRWWYMLNHSTDKERLQRLRNFDDASKNALAYLATCVFREDGRACKNTAHDARKLQILSAHVRDHLDGKVPRFKDVATLARWDDEDAREREGVPIGAFWYDLTHSTDKERLQHLRNFDDASKNALAYLATCVFREDGRVCTAHDARKLKILSAHVRDHLDGKVPRQKDVATLARWDDEDAREREGVPIGAFWYDLTHSTDKERLQRLSVFDDASKNALEYLATCEPRKRKPRGRRAK